MDQMPVQVKSQQLIYWVAGIILILILVIGGISVIKKAPIVSPIPDDSEGVRIIFVTPEPTASDSAQITTSPSGTIKMSPTATPKVSPKSSAISSPEASESAKPSI